MRRCSLVAIHFGVPASAFRTRPGGHHILPCVISCRYSTPLSVMDSVSAGEKALSRLAQSTDFQVSTSKRCFGAPRQPLGLHYDFCSTDARRPAAHVGAERGIEWVECWCGARELVLCPELRRLRCSVRLSKMPRGAPAPAQEKCVNRRGASESLC